MNQDRASKNGDGGLADHRDLALFVATLFERLGGRLEIDRHGRRHARRLDRSHLRRGPVPQLADATPSERFVSIEEWQGAVKLAEYWLARLGDADREYVFTLLGRTELDPPHRFDFRERM